MGLEPTSTLATRAHAVVREHVLLSAACALVPEPVLCTTAVTGVHLRMLTELSDLYGVRFRPKVGRVLLKAAGVGLLTDVLLAQPFARRALAAAAPVILPVCFIGGSILAGSFTHLLGHAFVRHYEGGGTFADFDWRGLRREIADRFAGRAGGRRSITAEA